MQENIVKHDGLNLCFSTLVYRIIEVPLYVQICESGTEIIADSIFFADTFVVFPEPVVKNSTEIKQGKH